MPLTGSVSSRAGWEFGVVAASPSSSANVLYNLTWLDMENFSSVRVNSYSSVSEGPAEMMRWRIDRNVDKLGFQTAGWSPSPRNWSESISNSRNRGSAVATALEYTASALDTALIARRVRLSGRMVGCTARHCRSVTPQRKQLYTVIGELNVCGFRLSSRAF